MGLSQAGGPSSEAADPSPKARDAPNRTPNEAPAGAENAGARPAPAAVVLGDPPGAIVPTDSFGQAGRKAMWPHVERLLKLEPSLADATRTEDLKRYRVATRRLRAALRLFGSAYPDRQVRRLRDALGDLGRAAGAVRDLDVRLADLEAWAGADRELAAGVGPLRRAWQAEREAAAAGLLARLQSRRHDRLIRGVVLLVEGSRRLTPDGQRSVRNTAASRIWRSFEELRESAAAVPTADLASLHDVRIHAKRLRYSLELLGDVLPDGRKDLIERLVALQDHLGAINDAAVIAGAVRSVLVDGRVEMTQDERAAIARYAVDRDRDVAGLRRGVERPWRAIASADFARRIGRTVVIA